MKQRQTSIEEYFTKQRKLKIIENIQTENEGTLITAQPILGRHQQCNQHCLDFQKRPAELQQLYFQQFCIQVLDLQICAEGIADYIKAKCQNKKFNQLKQIKNGKIKKKYIKKIPLNMNQRLLIQKYQLFGYSKSIISGLFNISLPQIQNNARILKQVKVKKEIFLLEEEKKWILNQASLGSNPMLFNIKLYYNAFKAKFQNSAFSLCQFRKLLHKLNIRFRIPSLKPLQFFQKEGRNEVVLHFIKQIWSLKMNNYKLIFVDECSLTNISKSSHKQWHTVGSFKQSIHRVSSFTCMIACMGEENFLKFQVINGTGKAIIFHQFLYSIALMAKQHFQSEKFVIILDNSKIHTANYVKELLSNIKHVFTPPYRPEFNAIEHLFGWLKRKLVTSQPLLFGQFMVQIHQILNQVSSAFIQNWCDSIYKPMSLEIAYMLP